MTKYITPATVTAALSIAAILAGAFGQTALQTFLNDPHTAQTVLTILGSVGSLVAAAMPGVKH